MAEPIDPVLARKLDAFTVPTLPEGFADRLLAAALAEPHRPRANCRSCDAPPRGAGCVAGWPGLASLPSE